jgi:hypothetical protein
MTSIALVSIAGAIALVRVWSLRGSRAALMTLAIPAALLPIVVGAITGAWDYQAEFRRIAETGSGGITGVIGVIRAWFGALFAGAVAGVAVLVVALILSWRTRTPSTPIRATGWSRTTALVIGAVIVTATVSLPIVVARSERAAVGPLIQLVPITSPAFQMDFGYPEARTMPTADLLLRLERDLRVATIGGLGLLMVLAGSLLLGGRLRSLNGAAATLVPAITVLAIAISAAGVWYSIHAHSVTQLLDDVARL